MREAKAIASALEGALHVVTLHAEAAREPAVRQALSGKRYLHLATHGLTGGEALLAGLALTPPPERGPSGDDDGVLCVPFDDCEQVYAAAKAKYDAEQRSMQAILAGTDDRS